MARDDWRIRVELAEDEHAGGFLERIGLGLSSEAGELARELTAQRLAASRDGPTVFVYTDSSLQAEQALRVVEAELRDQGHVATRVAIEHWLADESRWDDEAPESVEEEAAEAGDTGAWEVRVECESVVAAHELADRLEAEGLGTARRFRYVLVGAASREEAQALAGRLHGEVERAPSVWEVLPENPFAVFARIFGGGTGTPL